MATTVTLKPNAIDLSGSTSGTTTLQASAVAGTTTVTLPAATDTLVGKATTDTLTNKTLTSPTMTAPVLGTPASGTVTNLTGTASININGTVGATTATTGAFTTLSASTSAAIGSTGALANGELLKVAGKVYINAAESDTVFTTGAALIFPGTYNSFRQGTDHSFNLDTYNGGMQTNVLKILQNGNTAVTGALSSTSDATLSGLTVGKGAGAVSTNTAVGASALAANTSGAELTALGNNALQKNTTANWNIAVGSYALRETTTGASNTAIGYSALQLNTTASNNTAVGFQAGYSNTTGSETVAIGYKALYANTTAVENVGVGVYALTTNSTGRSNVSVGTSSLYFNTTGSYNVALGKSALESNTTASNNTAVGYQAGYTNTTGTSLTAIGYKAGYLSTGSANTFVGTNSGQAVSSGTSNAFFGEYSGFTATTGSFNTFIGAESGYLVTTGSKNVILGRYSGNQGGLDITASSNYIVLSDGDGNPKMYHNGSTTWHIAPDPANPITNRVGIDPNAVYPEPDNTHSLGYASYRWTTVYATTGTINTSDANLKQDIANLDDAEKRVAIAIKSLIKKYRFKDAVAKKGDAARIHIGAVAQEVQAAFVAEGLDPARYALFCSDTWYEVDGKAKDEDAFYTAETPNAVQVTQLGLRYEELLAFVIASL